MRARSSHRPSATPWAFALVAAPLLLIMVELLRGTIYETDRVTKQTQRDEIQALQSDGLQYGEGLQTLIQAHEASALGWSEIRKQPWFTDYWTRIRLDSGRDVYAAIVDNSGTIVMHSDPVRIGNRLGSGWYEKKISESGPDVVWTNRGSLSGDRPMFDVSTALAAELPLGEYHQGLDATWVDTKVRSELAGVTRRWFWVLLLIGGVDSAAIGALVYLARGQRQSSNALVATDRKRSREMAQLGSGLAHEVRNPLHALRLNLHTLKRAIGGQLLPEDQLIATIEESNDAIARLDALMRDFLQFADPSEGARENVDVFQALRTTLTLLHENLRRAQIQVRSSLPTGSAMVSINPLRLKQLLLNMLTFARNRVEKGGHIEIGAVVDSRAVEVTVGDNGPAILGEQQSRLFEPFQAPAETGSGLGLALVHAFAEEVGGKASWESDGTAGNRCRVRLPLTTPRTKGSSV